MNINYINTISNNVYSKINSPIYLNKIYSVSNTLNDDLEIFDDINNIHSIKNLAKKRRSKRLKKRLLISDKINEDVNRRNSEIETNFNYFNCKTDINPCSKYGIIKTKSSKNSYEDNKRYKKLNYLENKKNILFSIERVKKKLIAQNYQNYIKYINLNLKQQEHYREYDKYLKNELLKNRNSQIKLPMYTENYFRIDINKRNKIQLRKDIKDLYSPNFINNKLKNNFNKNRIASLNEIAKNEKHSSIEKSEPSLIEKSFNTIHVSKNKKLISYGENNNKRVLRINVDESKKRNTINLHNKKIKK